jgi:hypothetical protein
MDERAGYAARWAGRYSQKQRSQTTRLRPRHLFGHSVVTSRVANLNEHMMHAREGHVKERSESQKKERMHIRRLSKQQRARELRVTPGYQAHEHLFQIAQMLPTDYQPYGQLGRESFGDCSCGCRWYHVLAGRLGSDWGICANPASPRSGLLTFEHQGCSRFEDDPRTDFLDSAAGQKALQQFENGEEELRQWRKTHPVPHFYGNSLDD